MCDWPDAYSETTRRARKEHRCCECRRSIVPGETYHFASGIWKGEPSSFRTCLPCLAIREWLEIELRAGRVYDSEGCGTVVFGCLGELVLEAYEEEFPARPDCATCDGAGYDDDGWLCACRAQRPPPAPRDQGDVLMERP